MTVTSLEMTSPADLQPGAPPPSPVTLDHGPTALAVRDLYNRIWAPLGPSGRSDWTEAQWTAELSVEAHGSVGIVVFGLVPEFQSKGYGAAFLAAVVRTAWTLNALQLCATRLPHLRPPRQGVAMTVRRYGGVIATYDGQVALVREQYETWDAPYWSPPSGSIELGETPEAGSARELAEETGLKAPESSLTLIWRATVVLNGELTSHAWNYATTVDNDTLAVDDPDGAILEARWFPPSEAAALLTNLPYPPLSVPAVAYLQTGTPLAWTFTCTNNTWAWTTEPLSA